MLAYSSVLLLLHFLFKLVCRHSTLGSLHIEAFYFSCEVFAFRKLGIGIVPYSPLARGFFAGRAAKENISSESLLVKEVKLV